ncbi:MAG: hypothetical protein UR31_C0011G0032 [Parcubacteria group bacterium GW2011_GWA2_33_14]|nr:MAG: hypothetical protein UR31_C0011G0032 [Parcubacteria group bacterium GW2011_GWA2_33_14]
MIKKPFGSAQGGKMSTSMVHKMPADLQKVLNSSPSTLIAWEDITPLARNEWLCWIESAKKTETRIHRIKRTRTELIEGRRRPCCWAGCIHR